MSSRMKIQNSKKIGEIAEAEIRKRLLSISNPMKPSYDVGIDFFCDLLEEDSPSSKFFLVQAKGTQRFGKKWRRCIDKKIIESWLAHVYPVFLVVYDMEGDNCYWMSMHEHRKNLIRKMNTQSRTICITIDKSQLLREEDFVRKIKEDMASINFSVELLLGRPQFIGSGYVRRIPLLYLPNKVIHNIGVNIRLSLFYLASHYFYLAGQKQKAYSLCKFLTNFDKAHYDNFVLMGRICRSLGKTEEAKESYEEAIEICKRDTRWDTLKNPSDPSIGDIISSIRKEIESL